ncbi:MAG: hypothetical protein LBI53_05190 [Candidatus Peribacteria bacterium]|jgi:hypothetical protein|nr:hypothetical protein [Candidatus Peribacteria bacterium]
MIVTIFALVGLGMMVTILYYIFYGIVTLVVKPNESSYKKLQKLALAIGFAILIYILVVLITNSFLVYVNLPYLRFSFGDIFQLIGHRLQRRF